MDASDAAGDPSVDIGVTGGSLGSTVIPLTPALTSLALHHHADLSSLPDGTYSLVATATDLLGRHAVASEPVTWTSTSGFVPDHTMDALPNTPIGKSSTNPGDPSDPDTCGAKDGVDSLYPEFSLTFPRSCRTTDFQSESCTPSRPLRRISTFRCRMTTIGWADRRTNLNQTIDLGSLRPPTGGRRPDAPVSGATSPVEGPWYLNFVWFSSLGTASDVTYHVPMASI